MVVTSRQVVLAAATSVVATGALAVPSGAATLLVDDNRVQRPTAKYMGRRAFP